MDYLLSSPACVFNYQSVSEPDGHIISPNYPGLYPRNTECHYFFYGHALETVHITFLFFDVDGIAPRYVRFTYSCTFALNGRKRLKIRQKCAPSMSSFKSRLKTYLFRSVYKD